MPFDINTWLASGRSVDTVIAGERALDRHPDNGKHGYWCVYSDLHTTLVKNCAGAHEARRRAFPNGGQFSPTIHAIRFLGEELPDTLRL